MRPSRRPPNSSRSANALALARVATRLPQLEGRAIQVRFLPDLRAGSHKLYSARPHGQPVYAASFIRKRKMVLDRELLSRRGNLARILVHELFHFVWVRLSNRIRRSYLALLEMEWKEGARGELGWSAELRKSRLRGGIRVKNRAGKWRDYGCESFCDTAAWLYSGVRAHPEFTLAARYRRRRAEWFKSAFSGQVIPI
ncbi:MAG TPA: hypothetical protein VKX49_25485 [Bryobacteraceae bacterium]|nr:hypothetical protein [Bryobacteraceae bacterium]